MPEKYDEIWKEICGQIRKNVSPDTFRRWFSSTSLLDADEEKLLVKVPNNIYALWIESNYLGILGHAVVETLGEKRKIEFAFVSRKGAAEDLPELAEPENIENFADATAPVEALQSTGSDTREMGGQPPVRDVINPPKKEPGVEAQKPQQLESSGPSNKASDDAPSDPAFDRMIKRIGLNKFYRFENFVIGGNNEFASAAARAVSEGRSEGYNPLFIWGGAGLGKTHLLHAIGHEHLRRDSRSKVVYITCEQFTNEFIEALAQNSLSKFRNKYRRADVLLVDDIHFLAGKEKSMEEFFHTFNTICDGQRQIVLTSDRAANDIPDLEERIVSRCEWGLTAGLELPDVETRLAILRRKMAMWDVKLDDHIVEYLADRIRRSVRRLEGAMMRLASYASLSGKALTTDVIEGLLKDILREEGKSQVTNDSILKEVSETTSVSTEDLLSRKRTANVAFARQTCMYLGRVLTKHSLVEIGRFFERDHGTVIHAVRKVEQEMEKNMEVRRMINSLVTRLSRL